MLIAAGLLLWLVFAPLRPLDLAEVRGFASARGSVTLATAHALSWLGRGWLLLPASIIIGILLRRHTARPWALPLATLQAIVAQNAIKAIVDRPRPPVVHLEHVRSSSFPSGHAAEASAFLLTLALTIRPLLPRRWVGLVVTASATALALAIGASRVLLGVHYPTDAGAGLLLGGLAAGLNARAGGRPDASSSTRLADLR